MKRILNFYFRFPVLVDYVVAIVLTLSIRYLIRTNIISIPDYEHVLDLASETTTLTLTLAGFILTFLTLLITFKSSPNDNQQSMSLMSMFCNSSLYKQTVSLLKRCISSLIFLTFGIYALRFINIVGIEILYYWIILSVAVLLLTILRALFILSNILKLHA